MIDISKLRVVRPLGLALLLLLGAPACHTTKLAKVSETVDTFVQGQSNQNVSAFTQKPALVDILFVIRNGPSMCEKQQQLAAKFQQFITLLQAQSLDFQVAVVATDYSASQFSGNLVAQGANPRILDGGTVNLGQVFSQNVLAVGLNGSVRSQGLLAGLAAVTPPLSTGVNAAFLRKGASLAVIVVSDDDDYSLGLPPPTPDYFVNYFARAYAGIKGAGNEHLVSVSAIIGANDAGAPVDCNGTATNPSCTYNDATGHAGIRYAGVANGTGGLIQSICATDFGPLLSTFASHLSGLTHSFDLASIPVGSQLDTQGLVITVTPVSGAPYTVPQDPNNGWSYDGTNQAITFNGTGVPPPNAKVSIAYALLQKAFPLTNAPQLSTLTVKVAVGGVSTTVPQTTTDPNVGWSYDSTQNAIVFAPGSLPPAGAVIDVSYYF